MKETMTYLRNAGWKVELRPTHGPGDASRLTREAVDQHTSVVIVAGGDGTINEVIQELAGSETALGVIPSGTANVWARDMNIPVIMQAPGKCSCMAKREVLIWAM